MRRSQGKGVLGENRRFSPYPVKFLAIRFFGLSMYKNENGFLVAALYTSLSTPNSDDILFASLDDGNS